jgi:hypothetical protein
MMHKETFLYLVAPLQNVSAPIFKLPVEVDELLKISKIFIYFFAFLKSVMSFRQIAVPLFCKIFILETRFWRQGEVINLIKKSNCQPML